jgi:hypothetical protein
MFTGGHESTQIQLVRGAQKIFPFIFFALEKTFEIILRSRGYAPPLGRPGCDSAVLPVHKNARSFNDI